MDADKVAIRTVRVGAMLQAVVSGRYPLACEAADRVELVREGERLADAAGSLLAHGIVSKRKVSA
ncbi:hypothetical protein ACWEC4_16345 [Streptomyces sp. NPDC005055]